MPLRIGFGPLTMQRPGNTPEWRVLYADALDVVERIESLGFDSVWVSEHHFANDGYLSACMPMLAAIAARTSRITLGSRVIVAPLHQPIRLAEDAAAVQAISGGRLILGLSAGYRRVEFEALTGTMSRRGARLDDAIALCRLAWGGQAFDLEHDGRTVPDLRCLPGAEIPIWLGGRAPSALRRAGRTGDGFVAPAGTPEELSSLLATVDDAHGTQNSPLPVCVSAYVALDEFAESTYPGIERMLAGYAGMTRRDNPDSKVGQATSRSTMIVAGDPHKVAGKLLEYALVAGASRSLDLVVRLEYPGMSREQVMAHAEAFALQVMPMLRSKAPSL
jgi:alkanesulfonate monooxygenase SsuD/methylene tetrahydromethanopterin reductase-like flavin-dependent oxidoreductase (luciferase family)